MIDGAGEGGDDVAVDEGEAGSDDVLGGESEPEAAEEPWAGGARGGGHGLEVGPGGLLHQAVAD